MSGHTHAVPQPTLELVECADRLHGDLLPQASARTHDPAWNGRPSDAGAFNRMVVASREMMASTTIVAA